VVVIVVVRGWCDVACGVWTVVVVVAWRWVVGSLAAAIVAWRWVVVGSLATTATGCGTGDGTGEDEGDGTGGVVVTTRSARGLVITMAACTGAGARGAARGDSAGGGVPGVAGNVAMTGGGWPVATTCGARDRFA